MMIIATIILMPIMPVLTNSNNVQGGVPDDHTIRKMIMAADVRDVADVIALGEKAFPAYERILADPKVGSFTVVRIFGILASVKMKGDRSQFLERAVAELASRDGLVRWSAVGLLAKIGSERDTPPIIALLSDEDFTTGIVAAAAVQAIGGPRDLVALDTWLRANSDKRYTPKYRKQYEILREYVTKSRDELKQRLDKEKEKAKKPIAQADDPRDDMAIRLLFTANEFKEQREALISHGEKLFQAYERILADKNATRREIGGIFGVLIEVQADRSRFLERAVAELASPDSGVRRNAVRLLAEIGSQRDTPPVHSLLSDEDFTVGVAAAMTIQAIGGSRDLAALNTWLAVSNDKRYSSEYRKQYEVLREHVTKARDGLKQRLDKEKATRPKTQ